MAYCKDLLMFSQNINDSDINLGNAIVSLETDKPIVIKDFSSLAALQSNPALSIKTQTINQLHQSLDSANYEELKNHQLAKSIKASQSKKSPILDNKALDLLKNKSLLLESPRSNIKNQAKARALEQQTDKEVQSITEQQTSLNPSLSYLKQAKLSHKSKLELNPQLAHQASLFKEQHVTKELSPEQAHLTNLLNIKSLDTDYIEPPSYISQQLCHIFHKHHLYRNLPPDFLDPKEHSTLYRTGLLDELESHINSIAHYKTHYEQSATPKVSKPYMLRTKKDVHNISTAQSFQCLAQSKEQYIRPELNIPLQNKEPTSQVTQKITLQSQLHLSRFNEELLAIKQEATKTYEEQPHLLHQKTKRLKFLSYRDLARKAVAKSPDYSKCMFELNSDFNLNQAWFVYLSHSSELLPSIYKYVEQMIEEQEKRLNEALDLQFKSGWCESFGLKQMNCDHMAVRFAQNDFYLKDLLHMSTVQWYS